MEQEIELGEFVDGMILPKRADDAGRRCLSVFRCVWQMQHTCI